MPAALAAYLNNALQLTAYSLRFAALRSGFRQQLKAGVRLQEVPCFLVWLSYNHPQKGDHYVT